MKIFSGNSNVPFAEAVANYMDTTLSKCSVRRFADNEVFVEVQETVRGQDVYIIQPTSTPVNDNLMELLIMLDTFRRSSARRITAVVPYFGYARQDRRSAPRTPISAKLVANLITSAGANRVVTMDLHAGQIQGFFDIPVDNLMAAPKTDNAEIDFQLKPDTQALIEPRKQDVVLDAPAPEPEAEPVKERVALVEPVKPELLQPLVAAPVAAQKPVLKLVVPPKQRQKPAFTLKAPEPAKPALVLKMPETQKLAFTLKEPVAEEAFKQEIGAVLFNGNSAALPASAKAVVNEAVQAWNDNSIAVLQVRHAGGSLAERRARAVADTLKRAGAEQVETVAAEMPLSSAVEVCLVY